MLKTKYLHLLVLLPININNTDNTRERLVEINLDENRKMNSASIINMGTQLSSGIYQGHLWCSGLHIFIKLGYSN